MPPGAGRRLCVLFHESEVLGAGVSVLRAIGELRGCGWVCSGWFPGYGPLVEESEAALADRGFREKPIAFSLRAWRRDPGIAARLRRTPGYLRALERWLSANAPDVVHANSLLMLPEATLARRCGLPVIVQVHELPPPSWKRHVSLRWAAAVADVLVGVSEPVSRMLREHAGRTPVLTIHNGVPESPLARPAEGEFVVGSIGHVSWTKGTDVFLEAARLALAARPQLRFEHVGPGRIWHEDAFDRRVEELAASPTLRGALRMLGRGPTADSLARWNLFVLPSRQEAFPLSTLEAMAAGVPVVASAVGGILEQVEHLDTGILVPPEDPSAVAEWIVRLYDDRGLRLRLATAGRNHVRGAFPLREQAERLDHAYGRAVARRHRQRRSARSGNGRFTLRR
jgi:glycosyltransferase involved in cell wall biosynthesis